MARAPQDLFLADALEANRLGELTDAQRQGFRALSRFRRADRLRIAAFLVAGALIVGFFASPTASLAKRALIVLVCLVIAAWLVMRSITGADALTRDLGDGRVESVEGAVGKRRVGAGRAPDIYYLDVGDKSFTVSPATYQAAPDAGYVRLFFLPRSKKIVNLERLPDRDGEPIRSPADLLHSLGDSFLTRNRRERNEARAHLSEQANALQAMVAAPASAPPLSQRDPRPLGEAILGTWSNGMVTVAFSADGSVTTNMIGRALRGHWSVDASGRLRADMMGTSQAADAWVVGDELTISAGDSGMKLRRVT